MIDALVLAGSLNKGELSKCSSARYEALIPVGQKYMVDHVVDALKDCGRINRIVIVGPEKELKRKTWEEDMQIIEPRESIAENIMQGLDYLPGAERVLIVTSDIPLVNSRSILNFLDLCGDMQADLYYPIVPQEIIKKRFSVSKRTYVNLKDGVFTGGNVFLLNPAVVWQCMPRGEKLLNARKSPLKLCRLVGIIFLIRYLTGNVTLYKAQKKVSKVLGIKGKVVISTDPELGIDVDKPSDLELVNEKLGVAK